MTADQLIDTCIVRCGSYWPSTTTATNNSVSW